MKKIILTMAVVLTANFASAQDMKDGSEGFAKSDLYLSGTAGFSSEKTGDSKLDGFSLSPSLGYFLTQNIAIEGGLSITSAKDDDGAGNELKANGFGFNAGARYFWTPASKFSLSVGANISYTSTKLDDGVADFTTKEIGFNIPLGMNYFVSNDFALTAQWGGFGYSSNDNGGNGADKTTALNLDLDLSTINFGLIYKL
jgi:hypothetical protein